MHGYTRLLLDSHHRKGSTPIVLKKKMAELKLIRANVGSRDRRVVCGKLGISGPEVRNRLATVVINAVLDEKRAFSSKNFDKEIVAWACI